MSFPLSQETNVWSIDKKITSYLFPFFPSLGYCVIGLLRANKMLQQEEEHKSFTIILMEGSDHSQYNHSRYKTRRRRAQHLLYLKQGTLSATVNTSLDVGVGLIV